MEIGLVTLSLDLAIVHSYSFTRNDRHYVYIIIIDIKSFFTGPSAANLSVWKISSQLEVSRLISLQSQG